MTEHLARLQTFYNQQAEIKLRLQNCFLEVSKIITGPFRTLKHTHLLSTVPTKKIEITRLKDWEKKNDIRQTRRKQHQQINYCTWKKTHTQMILTTFSSSLPELSGLVSSPDELELESISSLWCIILRYFLFFLWREVQTASRHNQNPTHSDRHIGRVHLWGLARADFLQMPQASRSHISLGTPGMERETNDCTVFCYTYFHLPYCHISC